MPLWRTPPKGASQTPKVTAMSLMLQLPELTRLASFSPLSMSSVHTLDDRP
jgi:hypothetical protein